MSAPVITDRADPRYAGALTRRCQICKAKAGNDCRNTIDQAVPLPGARLVHFERIEIADNDRS